MGTEQAKFGFIVIEPGLVPFGAGMAAVALFTVGSAVDIIDLVAGGAGFWCLLITTVWMAGGTQRLLVSALQWKVSFVVIKGFFSPALAGVAICTLFTEVSVVGIVLLVAGNATVWRLTP